MKRRILSLLLALCLIVGLLPLTALAEEATEVTASLTVTTGNNNAKIQWKPTLSIGMAPAYAKTTAEGALVLEGATATDYNLKAEWPVDGKPTLTMNGATLANDTSNINTANTVYHTVVVGGSADWEILLKGTNTINGNHNSGSTTTANHRMAAGIRGNNTGTLTIKSLDREVDTLTIDNYGGNGLYKNYNALTLDSANITIRMQNTASNAQIAIVMAYNTAGCEDKTNLTVKDSYLTIRNPGKTSNFYITMGETGGYDYTKPADLLNTGDILFQNSKVYMNRDNGSSFNSRGAEGIKFGPNATCTFDNCDFDIRGNHRAFTYAPTVTNCINVQSKTGWSDWAEYTVTPGTLLSANTNNSGLRGTHTCAAGEPVIEKHAGECVETADSVTYCTAFFCGKELSREPVELTPSKAHTPGTKTLVDGSMTKPTNQGHFSVTTKGTYDLQCTCTVCGTTWTETKEYLPAALWYVTASNDYKSTADKTVPKYELNAYWGNQGTGYTPTVTVLPGQTAYFVTEIGTNANIPTSAYIRKLSTSTTADAAIIEAGTWNMKLEYPIGGDPVLTMQDATIINCVALWYGYAGFRNMAPLTIVLKGENTIRQTRYTNGGGLNFKTMSPVTITGDGSLDLFTYGNHAGIRSYGGDLIFDHANIQYTHYTSGSAADAVQTQTAGDIIIDGGIFNMIGANPTAHEAVNGFNATAGNIVIKGGANVSLTNALNAKTSYMLNASGDITISESTVRLACVYDGYAMSCGGELTLDYANGFTANAINTKTTLVDGVYTYPDLSGAAKLTTKDEVLTKMSAVRYLDITPNKALANFTGTSVTVKEDLDVNFKLDADKVDTNGTVTFTVNGVPTSKPLSEVGEKEGNDYVVTLPGLSAKEMTTEITVTIYDSEGKAVSETKSDSVQAYALRLLRDSKYADDTNAENKALKTFLVDMLIYGSMAQTRFLDKESVGTLPTAVLNAKEWGYATAEAPTIENATKPSGEGYIGTSFELKSDIGMAIALDATVLADVTKAVVTFTDYKGNPQTATIEQKDISSDDNFTVFVFDKLTAANGRQDITWEFYTDSSNEAVLTVTDSLAAYVGRMREAHPDLDELLKYCDSAAAYFTLLNAQN